MAIMAVLLILFLRQKRVGLYMEHAFVRTLLITMACVALDILSIAAIVYRDRIPGPLLALSCRAYLGSILWVGYAANTYITAELYHAHSYRKKVRTALSVTVVTNIVLFVLPISYHSDGFYVYTYGPAVLCTYAFMLVYMLALVYLLVRYGKKIEKKRKRAVLIWMFLWFAAGIIQFCNNQFLLAGLACGLGMLTIYCTLENPENNIDHRFDCFHHHVLVSYFNQCYEKNVPQALIYLQIVDDQHFEQDYVDQCMHKLIDFFRAFPKAKIFKGMEHDIAAVFPDMTDMTHAFTRLQDTFYNHQFYNMDAVKTNDFPKTLFMLFPDTSLMDSTDEMMGIRRYLAIENSNITSSRVCYVNAQMLTQIRHKDLMREKIMKALEEDRVEVFYQPIYSIKDQAFTSAEALVRIRNTDGSLLSPGQFIPVAEENGLITVLGERVFEKVCEFLQKNSPKQLGIHYIEVNLSVIQCQQRFLADRYMDIMKKYGTESWYINLEITETGSVSAKNTLLENMNRLIDKGVSFSLDDFGNGQSNLDYMIDMPVAIMKLDMNMTQAYFKDLKAKFVVKAIINLAHELDLFVVAEGVETKEQLDEMVALHVDYIQGFYFSRPLPADEFIRFLEEHASAGGG